jgi:pimeloyl-ACP methyl ester carboxylesterase
MRNSWNLVTSFTKEYYLAITYPFVTWFLHPKIYRNPRPKGTILLVGCWFNANVYHNIWVSYLEKLGFRTYFLDLPFARENFDATTRRLAQFISRHKLKNYTIVGVSSGVLVCWNYLSTYKKWNKIHKFISMGGPVQGTITAWLITFTSKGRAMVPRSGFIKKLHSAPFPKQKMITLTAKSDELVPFKYATMDGVTNYQLSGWGHNSFHLDSKDTYEIIAKIAGGKNSKKIINASPARTSRRTQRAFSKSSVRSTMSNPQLQGSSLALSSGS